MPTWQLIWQVVVSILETAPDIQRWSDVPGQAACDLHCDFLTVISRTGLRVGHEDMNFL